jgi:hypothetical protein
VIIAVAPTAIRPDERGDAPLDAGIQILRARQAGSITGKRVDEIERDVVGRDPNVDRERRFDLRRGDRRDNAGRTQDYDDSK